MGQVFKGRLIMIRLFLFVLFFICLGLETGHAHRRISVQVSLDGVLFTCDRLSWSSRGVCICPQTEAVIYRTRVYRGHRTVSRRSRGGYRVRYRRNARRHIPRRRVRRGRVNTRRRTVNTRRRTVNTRRRTVNTRRVRRS